MTSPLETPGDRCSQCIGWRFEDCKHLKISETFRIQNLGKTYTVNLKL